jgi:predicted dehydrogenase
MDRSTEPVPIRVGIIGCGLIAQVMHLPNLRDMPGLFEVGAVCDVAPGPLDFAHRLFPQATRHENWIDLLDHELDAVLVLTPGSHAPMAISAARAGLHVFVEKPMCFSAAEGAEMIAAAEESGVVLMVGYMKRYDPAYLALKRTLDPDEVTFARVTTLECPIDPYALHLQRATPGSVDATVTAELEADDQRRLRAAIPTADPALLRAYRVALLDSMVHELNAVRGLLGEPTELHWARIWDRPMRVALAASFGPGVATFSWIDLPGIARYEQEIALYGPERRNRLVFPSPLLRDYPAELVVEGGDPGGIESWRTIRTVSYEESFKAELLGFHEAASNGSTPRTDGLDAVRDVAFVQAIVRCHLEGVSIPDPTSLESIGLREASAIMGTDPDDDSQR